MSATTLTCPFPQRHGGDMLMYEDYYGFAEKPFSLTPDPKYFFRSESHSSALDLLQYAVRRREGFVVITGDIGTGKTTLCRALLDQLDRKTFSALVLNPFLTEEDLLRLILQEFGVVSREEMRAGRLAYVTKQELIETLNDFLVSLLPLGAGAVLIIDEAQNLPMRTLEQIRILSNLETDKEKLLQIILAGQLNLQPLLRSPELRQLDQRVSIRYEIKPLSRDEVRAYVAHRMRVAGGGGDAVTFTPRALDRVHRITQGIPRLVNLLCDRALLCAFSDVKSRIVPEMVARAGVSLQLADPSRGTLGRVRRRAAAVAIAALITTGALAATTWYAARWAARIDAAAAAMSPPAAPVAIAPTGLTPPPGLP
jgi:general secretion pathway protein A